MSNNTDKVTQLKDIYTPLFEYVVIEFTIPTTVTKTNIKLQGEAAKEYQKEQTPVMKVIAVGNDVKTVKVGDWILPSPRFNPHQVPLLYKNSKEGTQHAQIHISEVMGIVDETFALIKNGIKEPAIN